MVNIPSIIFFYIVEAVSTKTGPKAHPSKIPSRFRQTSLPSLVITRNRQRPGQTAGALSSVSFC